MNHDAIEILSLITWLQLCLLTSILIVYRRGKRTSNLLLAGFLFANSILPAHHFIIQFNWLPTYFDTYLRIFGAAAYSLLLPFLYLYILSLCDSAFKIKPTHLLHGLSYLFIVLLSLIIYNLTLRADTGTFLNQYGDNLRIKIFYFFIHIQIAAYLIVVFKKLTKYRNEIKENFSFTEKINLSWLMILLVGFTAMWLINLFQWSAGVFDINLGTINYTLTLIAVVINLLFALTITYKSISQSDYLSGIAAPRRYINSSLTLPDCKKIVEKLITKMEEEKIYIKPALTLEDLSASVEIPARHISQSIKVTLQSNFYDFINKYRVEEFKRRLSEESSQHLSFIALAYESGFSSKSVFNSAFKKFVGMTPKEYKNFITKKK